MNELKAKCEQIEKRAQEQRQVEEKKHTEEIQFLKRTNQQLKVNIPSYNVGFKHIFLGRWEIEILVIIRGNNPFNPGSSDFDC